MIMNSNYKILIRYSPDKYQKFGFCISRAMSESDSAERNTKREDEAKHLWRKLRPHGFQLRAPFTAWRVPPCRKH